MERPAPPAQPLGAQKSSGPCWRATCRAVEIARHLPRRLLVHLKSWRLVEVALNSCITTGLNTEVFRAAAGAALSWAHGLPVSIDTLLATYRTDVAAALTEVRSTPELLSDPEPSRR
jgi:hypothetical protein